MFVGRDDTIYVGAAFKDATAKKGELRGIVIGNATATGVGVSSAVTPCNAKLSSDADCPATKAAWPTVKVADCDPMPPDDSVKVLAPVLVNAGCDEKLKPVGNVTVKREFPSSVPVVSRP